VTELKNNCIKHLHCRLLIQILFEAESTRPHSVS